MNQNKKLAQEAARQICFNWSRSTVEDVEAIILAAIEKAYETWRGDEGANEPAAHPQAATAGKLREKFPNCPHGVPADECTAAARDPSSEPQKWHDPLEFMRKERRKSFENDATLEHIRNTTPQEWTHRLLRDEWGISDWAMREVVLKHHKAALAAAKLDALAQRSEEVISDDPPETVIEIDEHGKVHHPTASSEPQRSEKLSSVHDASGVCTGFEGAESNEPTEWWNDGAYIYCGKTVMGNGRTFVARAYDSQDAKAACDAHKAALAAEREKRKPLMQALEAALSVGEIRFGTCTLSRDVKAKIDAALAKAKGKP